MKKLAIGVDIGGINTAFGLVDENGDLYAESVISTKKYPHVDDYPAYVEDLCQAMHALADSLSFEYELTGIGIGAPNANFHKGTVENPANLWKFREGDPNPDESRRVFPLADGNMLKRSVWRGPSVQRTVASASSGTSAPVELGT